MYLVVSVLDIAALTALAYGLNFYATGKRALALHFIDGLLKNDILLPVGLLLLVFIAKNFLAYWSGSRLYRFVGNVATRISSANLNRYLQNGYTDYVNSDSATLIKKINHHPVQFAQHLVLGSQQIITELAMAGLISLLLLIYDWKLFIAVMIVLGPTIMLLSYITRSSLKTIRRNIKTSDQQLLKYLNESLSGFIESNIYARNNFFVTRYRQMLHKVNSYIATMQILQNVPARFFETFILFGLFVVLLFNRYFDHNTSNAIFTIGAFSAACYKIMPGISRIINWNGQLYTFQYTVDELISSRNEFVPEANPLKPVPISSIQFRKLNFSYDNKKIIDSLDLQISKGSLVIVNGVSGRGKTTLINLLLGFLQPASGEVLLGDQPTGPGNTGSWADIAYVKQEPFLIEDSLLNNIVLFDTAYDQQRLNTIIDTVGLSPFVAEYTLGLQTVITEGGKNISGGQRQRIAIARALYKNTNVVLLDEPFNELDEPSENHLLQYFRKLADEGKIIILITHNTQSFSFADQLISLNNG